MNFELNINLHSFTAINTLSMFSEFEPVDKQQWLEKITKELGGRKTLEDLQQKIDDGLVSDPLLQYEDLVINEDITSFPTTCYNGLYIDNELPPSELLEYLQLGISGLYIENLGYKKLIELLKDVELSYIFSVIFSQEKLDTKIVNDDSENSPIIINDPINKLSISNSLRSGTLIDDLKTHIAKVRHTGVLGIEMNDQFLLQMAIFRACRIVLQKNTKKDFKIIGFTSLTQETDEANLIALTNQTLAAKIGGLDMIMMSRTSRDDNISIKRHLHICNILDMESGMEKLNDPLKGSYYIEHLTKQLVGLMSFHLRQDFGGRGMN